MEEYSNYLRVNWQDGMKLNKEHFIAADLFHVNQGNLSRQIGLNETNFGLLPAPDSKEPCLNLELHYEAGMLTISQYTFRAIMLNGTLVDADSRRFNMQNADPGRYIFKQAVDNASDSRFVVVLRANAFNGEPFGAVDSKNHPLARPFLRPHFELIVEPDKHFRQSFFGQDFFILARFSLNQHEAVIDKEYIAPSCFVVSHPNLTALYRDLCEKIRMLELYNLEVGKKYAHPGSGAYNETLGFLAQNLLIALTTMKFSLRHLLLYKEPLKMIILVQELCNIFYQSLEFRTTLGKEKFFVEMSRILGLSKIDFEQIIKNLMSLEYRHYDIMTSINQAWAFLNLITTLFKSLSEYDKTKRSPDITI